MKTILQGAVLALSKHEISKKGGATQKIYESSLEVLMLCQESRLLYFEWQVSMQSKKKKSDTMQHKKKKNWFRNLLVVVVSLILVGGVSLFFMLIQSSVPLMLVICLIN